MRLWISHQTFLPGDEFRGMIAMQDMLRAAFDFLYKYMRRIRLHSRRLLSASVVLLVVGVVALSTATRRPYLHVQTASWHITKAGHLSASEGQECSKARSRAAAESRREIPTDPPSISSFHVSHEEVISPAQAIVTQSRHLRAPPSLS